MPSYVMHVVSTLRAFTTASSFDSVGWEGVEGLEEVVRRQPQAVGTREDEGSAGSGREAEDHSSESDDNEGSQDEYVADAAKQTSGKRRVRRVSVSSDSDLEPEVASRQHRTTKKTRHVGGAGQDVAVRATSGSPTPNNLAKRRQSSASQPPPKRTKTESGEDPTRKYCLTKLQEVFCKIFLRYPFLRGETQNEGLGSGLEPDKQPEELTDEDREKLEAAAKRVAADLEQCIYELYSEPDKSGKRIAAGKYKERFRMLSFNLSKPDRVLLHKRIASSQITPKELSTMSSTDLADEETKQSIKQAEQEALAHSILKKQSLPRAKITHKGIENIEDLNGAAQRDLEREREEEEEERIERERQARLRLQAERARSASSLGQGSVPPESPIVSQIGRAHV